MSTKAAVSIDEYLRSSYEKPEPEWIDGEIVERSLPNKQHSQTQGELVFRFNLARDRVPVHVMPELRVRTSPAQLRVIDVAVFSPILPPEQLIATPPLVAVEILSPDDRLVDVRAKFDEYLAWGVSHVILADPHVRLVYRYDGDLTRVSSLDIPEIGIHLSPDEIFGPAAS